MTATQELKHRAEAKMKHLEGRLRELQADASHTKDEAVRSVKRQLDELKHAAREGWDHLSDATAKKVNELLK